MAQTMDTFRPVARLDELREGLGHRVVVEGQQIAIFLTGGEVMAVEANCPHAGGPLEDGIVCDKVVVCPLHQRRVDLRSGEVEDWPDPVRTYPVAIEDGQVLVRL